MSDEPKANCPTCGAAAERLLSAGAGFLFKGDGFYITDYRSESYRKAAKADRGEGSGEGGAKGDKTEKGSAKGDKSAVSEGKGSTTGSSGTSDSTSKAGKSSGSEAPKTPKKPD
jgi:predicted nucleic acid-binding Zn ribbon protein